MRSYSDLPGEIISDILSRLPANSVGICRCVSKPWRTLLTRPEFIRTHLSKCRITHQESLTFVDSERCIVSAPLRDAHHLFDEITLTPKKVVFGCHPNLWGWVLAGCDGLLLVSDKQGMKLVNPTTKVIMEVPHLEFCLDHFKNNYIVWGLGYDSVNHDYKIVANSYYGFQYDDYYNDIEPDCADMFVNVYSMKTGSWKRVESSPCFQSNPSKSDLAVFLDGCIHWLERRTIDQKCTIVAFDLAEEKFSEVPLPISIGHYMPPYNSVDNYELAALGGCLCVVDRTGPDVWVMKEYGVQESWIKKFTIDHHELPRVIRLLGFWGEEEVLMRYNESLVAYNLKGGSLKDVVVHGIEGNLHNVVILMETLVP